MQNSFYVKSLLFFTILYVVIDLSSLIFSFKVIEFNHVSFIASSLAFPLTYAMMDIITEIYGYKISKLIIFYSLGCDLIFALLVAAISHIPSITFAETTAYINILSLLPKAVIAQTIGVLIGALINASLISKWKIMAKGKYFWLRSIGSSLLGESFMLVISLTIALSSIISYNKLILIASYTLIYKLLFATIISPPIGLIVIYLQNKINNENNRHANSNDKIEGILV